MATDPVCGMEVNEKKAAATATHQGKTYFFCAPSCKATFVKAPEKYVAAEKGGRKGCA
jgi:Cu+-exporting ATPase